MYFSTNKSSDTGSKKGDYAQDTNRFGIKCQVYEGQKPPQIYMRSLSH